MVITRKMVVRVGTKSEEGHTSQMTLPKTQERSKGQEDPGDLTKGS